MLLRVVDEYSAPFKGKDIRILAQNDPPDLRCDEFPETALVAVHRKLDQVCYGKLPGERLTSKITIAPSDTAEPYLEVVKQK